MNAMGSGDRPARSPDKRQERTFVQRKQCFVCGGTGVEQYFGNFWNRERPLIPIFIVGNWKTPTAPFETAEFQWFSSTTMPSPTDRDKHSRRFKTWVGSIWSTRRTARTFPQATSTYSDRWNTGCEEKSSERSKKCSNLLPNSLILRTENGTAVGSTNSKNNGKK